MPSGGLVQLGQGPTFFVTTVVHPVVESVAINVSVPPVLSQMMSTLLPVAEGGVPPEANHEYV